jgi:uncharacterized membrane protein YphA (DoxX/SURF4 family)
VLAHDAESSGFTRTRKSLFWIRVSIQHPETRGSILQRLYSGFPGGWPGIALLLLRAVFGSALLWRGAACIRETALGDAGWFLGATALIAGLLLVLGLLTPIVAAAIVLAAVGAELEHASACSILFNADLPLVFAATRLLAIVILGPGAISIDARHFGRREIIIVPPTIRSQE